jgi:hypothetical protein
MGFDAKYYTTHTAEPKSKVKLDNLTLDAFDNIIENASLSNQDRHAAAVEQADMHSFLAACPWYKRTPANDKLVSHWLEQKGIRYSTFPELVEATEELAKAGLLSGMDEAAFAQHLDGNGPKIFKGTLTGQTYDSLESLVAQQRHAALRTVEAPSDIEEAFQSMPAEQALQMLRDGERQHQTNANAQISQQNADSWITLHPEFRDDTYNGKLMAAQLKLNGVTGAVTIEDYEIAERQLVEAGMIRQNPAVLKKQQAAEVVARAKRAVETPGSPWDTTTENQMYELPLDEVRRRANGNYTGVGY